VARQRVKDEPWYQQWREALDRVIRAQMARDKARRGKQRTKGFGFRYVRACLIRVAGNECRDEVLESCGRVARIPQMY
jgi:hypothetical protein